RRRRVRVLDRQLSSETLRAQPGPAAVELELGVVRHLYPHVAEGDEAGVAPRHARDAADGLAVEAQLRVVGRRLAGSQLEDAKRPVHPAPVVLPRDRLLARIA